MGSFPVAYPPAPLDTGADGSTPTMTGAISDHHHSRAAFGRRGLVDLTMPMSDQTIPHPGHPAPRLEPLHPVESAGMRNTVMQFSLHTGTHIDAPSHLLPGGASIDQIPIERFWRPALRLDLTDAEAETPIDLARLRAAGFESERAASVILLLATGWTDRSWRSKRLFEQSPFLVEDAASAVAAARPAALGLDFAIDRGKPWPNHAILLRAEVPLIENLMGLAALPHDGFEVIAFPFRLAGENGGPARVVASIPQ
jgi:arylformamidase